MNLRPQRVLDYWEDPLQGLVGMFDPFRVLGIQGLI